MSVTFTRRKALGLVAGLSAATLVGCSEGTPSGGTTTAGGGATTASGDSTAATGTTTKISVGVIPILDVAPIYLGVDQGFFADEGLDLTLESGQGGAAIVPGVTSGSLQFGFSNVVSLMLANARGLGLKALAAGAASTGDTEADFGAVLVKADSGIKRAADLAGKSIAVNTLQNIQTTTINEMVRADGGDPAGIQYVELAFPDIVPAIERGDVAAGQLVEPFRTIGLDAGLVSVGANYAATDPNLLVAAYFTTKSYADANPQIVTKFTAAMNKSLEYAQANPDAVRKILSTYTQIQPDVAAKAVLPKWDPEINRAAVQKLADLGTSDGLFPSAPDLDALLP